MLESRPEILVCACHHFDHGRLDFQLHPWPIPKIDKGSFFECVQRMVFCGPALPFGSRVSRNMP